MNESGAESRESESGTEKAIGVRQHDAKDLAYEKIAGDWAGFIDDYDTRRRVEVLLEQFLGRDKVSGKRCLDGGCGLGYFTRGLLALNAARVTAIDIAPTLVRQLGEQIPSADCRVGDLLDLSLALGDETFDVVVSSEVIEHTPDPERAVRELARRVAPGGWLAISCPNAQWRWLLTVAQTLRVRRAYDGYENWVRPDDLVTWVERAGLDVVRREGIHRLPWQFSNRVVELLDRRLEGRSYGASINLALLARRPSH